MYRALSSPKRCGNGMKVPLYLRVVSPKYLQKQQLFGYSMISSIVCTKVIYSLKCFQHMKAKDAEQLQMELFAQSWPRMCGSWVHTPASNPDTTNTETSKSEVQGAPQQWSESEAGLA